jgi:ABC-type microcin C transport system permease subunit YejE
MKKKIVKLLTDAQNTEEAVWIAISAFVICLVLLILNK